MTLVAESEEELKSLLIKVEEESEKAGLNSTFKNWRSWHLIPSLLENRWGNNGNSDRLYFLASLVAQKIKRLPAMQETWVQSLGQEDPLEKEMATHSSTIAGKIPRTDEPGRLHSPWGRKEADTTKQLHLFSWAPKSLQMVTAAMKLEDTCSLDEKPWQT